MSDESPESGDGESDEDIGIVRRQIDPDPSTAEYDLLDLISELEDRDITALPALYNEVDHVVETLYKTPPAPRAQMEITFSYAGYRITMDRTGAVRVVPVKESI